MEGKCCKNRGDYVFESLKKDILNLTLKPGQPISENEICTRFDVSRTPVREALRRLQEQGFVHTIPYSGTYVTRLNLEDIRQMIYMQQPDFDSEQFHQIDARMHAIWFEFLGKGKLWEFIQAQQLHYSRFRMLDFATETDFSRIIREHSYLLVLLEQQQERELEEALKKHLYISMTRMKHVIETEYREYFEL